MARLSVFSGSRRAFLEFDAAVISSGPLAGDRYWQTMSVLERKATRMHELARLRARHFVSPVVADSAMNLLVTLFISECQSINPGEQSIVLANHLAPLEGAALIDSLVQAGLAVATGKMPGRRTVGLTPLGSARMRAYITDFPELA